MRPFRRVRWASPRRRAGCHCRRTSPSGAAELADLGLGAGNDPCARFRVGIDQLLEAGTGRLLLADRGKGLAELEEIVRSLVAVREALESLEEGPCGFRVVALDVIGFAEPVQAIGGEIMVGVLQIGRASCRERVCQYVWI